MYKVIESWNALPRARFIAIARWLLYTGSIGARGTLDAYEGAIKCTGRMYGEVTGKVRTDPRVCCVWRAVAATVFARVHGHRWKCSKGLLQEWCEDANPFHRYNLVVRAIRMHIKASTLGVTRKMTSLRQGHIKKVLSNMHMGGLGMLQVCPRPRCLCMMWRFCLQSR